MTTTPSGKAGEWADVDSEAVRRLTERAEALGWRKALAEVEPTNPFFVRRLRSPWLVNWHLLLGLPRRGEALDLGCGFGTLTLGLGAFFARATGLDFLPDRIRFASLRAVQEGLANITYRQGSALELVPEAGRFDLVVMNGVLEWAGLFGAGDPRQLQESVLGRVRALLTAQGSVAVAIENRFAMETLAGMPDTHTGLRGLPLLPWWLASLVHRGRRGGPLRSWLRSRGGYARLFRGAGFESVRTLDAISSYNDYDYLVEATDQESHAFLWRHQGVRGFYPRADRWRRTLSQRWPELLGQLAYAYVVMAGAEHPLLFDREHALWDWVVQRGGDAGLRRFACRHTTPGCLFLVSHDGNRLRTVVELGAALPDPGDGPGDRLPPGLQPLLGELVARGEGTVGDLAVRVFRTG